MRSDIPGPDRSGAVCPLLGRICRLVLWTLFAFAHPALAEAEDGDGPAEQFMALNVIASGAHACGANRDDVIKLSNAIADEFGREYPPLASHMTRAWVEESVFELSEAMTKAKDSPGPFGKPCSQYRQTFDLLLAVPEGIGHMVGPRDKVEAATEDEPTMTLDELKTALTSQTDAIPKGQLGAYAGCWRSQSTPSTVTLCFVDGGDAVNVVIEGPKGTRCDYSGGRARPRNDGAFFYGFAPNGSCSNGQVTEHVEGYCDRINGMTCLTSFFSTGNTMLSISDDPELSHYNTEMTYRRAKP